ncbi:MAG: hypothetical protein KME04_17720 [Pleurocapsa minor GSE-CHR-MK-17-07R]|nr:hypothetical protein [Pleurocapsa minor GSE-CHR-MK 17-07R]
MTIVKQGSYHLLMTLAAIIGLIGTAAFFFFGVGYINLALLFLAMFISYIAITLTLGYALSHFYQPTRRQVLITNIVMSVFAVIGGFVFGKLLVG